MHAILRSVPDSFSRALCATTPATPIDPVLARAQHAAYRTALEACGVGTHVVAADEACPDCCFVEDAAVVSGGVALIARSAAPSRRAEAEAVAEALSATHELVRMTEPATLDGGDCMRVGRTLYVGRSARTNGEGMAQLSRAFPRLRTVAVDLPPGVLHLKCVCSPLGDDRIALAEGTISASAFDAQVVWVPAAESYAANVVAVGNHALVAEGHPRTHEALLAAGFVVHAVPVSEARKADGSLTCQSLLW